MDLLIKISRYASPRNIMARSTGICYLYKTKVIIRFPVLLLYGRNAKGVLVR